MLLTWSPLIKPYVWGQNWSATSFCWQEIRKRKQGRWIRQPRDPFWTIPVHYESMINSKFQVNKSLFHTRIVTLYVCLPGTTCLWCTSWEWTPLAGYSWPSSSSTRTTSSRASPAPSPSSSHQSSQSFSSVFNFLCRDANQCWLKSTYVSWQIVEQIWNYTGCSTGSWTWLDLTLIWVFHHLGLLPSRLCHKYLSAQTELCRQWNIQILSQPNPINGQMGHPVENLEVPTAALNIALVCRRWRPRYRIHFPLRISTKTKERGDNREFWEKVTQNTFKGCINEGCGKMRCT